MADSVINGCDMSIGKGREQQIASITQWEAKREDRFSYIPSENITAEVYGSRTEGGVLRKARLLRK